MPQKTEQRAAIAFVLPTDQHRRLKVLAAERGLSISHLIRLALSDYMRREWNVDIPPADLEIGGWGGRR